MARRTAHTVAVAKAIFGPGHWEDASEMMRDAYIIVATKAIEALMETPVTEPMRRAWAATTDATSVDCWTNMLYETI